MPNFFTFEKVTTTTKVATTAGLVTMLIGAAMQSMFYYSDDETTSAIAFSSAITATGFLTCVASFMHHAMTNKATPTVPPSVNLQNSSVNSVPATEETPLLNLPVTAEHRM